VEQPDSKMTVNTESIRFVSPNVAIEQGTSVETIGGSTDAVSIVNDAPAND